MGKPFAESVFRHDDLSSRVRLIGTRCRRCAVRAFPARAVCASCRGRDLVESELGPYGRLYTFAVVHQAPVPFTPPYAIGYVDLDEGVRVFAQLEELENLVEGRRVELVVGTLYTDPEGEPVLAYKFRPAPEEG